MVIEFILENSQTFVAILDDRDVTISMLSVTLMCDVVRGFTGQMYADKPENWSHDVWFYCVSLML